MATLKSSLTTKELNYFAGLMDGEGCFCITKTKPDGKRKTARYTAFVSVNMCDIESLEDLRTAFGGSLYTGERQDENWKETTCWKVSSRKAEIVIQAILPYLRIGRKQEAAQACLELLMLPTTYNMKKGVPSNVLEAREACYQRTRKANARGTSSG